MNTHAIPISDAAAKLRDDPPSDYFAKKRLERQIETGCKGVRKHLTDAMHNIAKRVDDKSDVVREVVGEMTQQISSTHNKLWELDANHNTAGLIDTVTIGTVQCTVIEDVPGLTRVIEPRSSAVAMTSQN